MLKKIVAVLKKVEVCMAVNCIFAVLCVMCESHNTYCWSVMHDTVVAVLSTKEVHQSRISFGKVTLSANDDVLRVDDHIIISVISRLFVVGAQSMKELVYCNTFALQSNQNMIA